MLLRTHPVLIILLFSLGSFACRQEKTVESRNFRIFVATDDPALKETIERLTKHYNQGMAGKALNLVDSETESNSVISFQDDLRMDGHKLGTGQSIQATRPSKASNLPGETVTYHVDYGMRIIFDEGNFLSKAPKSTDQSSNEAKHLFHLFCHEIGHGMEMDHDDNKLSVMYPTIPEKPTREIDFKAYFERASNFLGKAPALPPEAAPAATGEESELSEEE